MPTPLVWLGKSLHSDGYFFTTPLRYLDGYLLQRPRVIWMGVFYNAPALSRYPDEKSQVELRLCNRLSRRLTVPSSPEELGDHEKRDECQNTDLAHSVSTFGHTRSPTNRKARASGQRSPGTAEAGAHRRLIE